jgi:hypothetical protein
MQEFAKRKKEAFRFQELPLAACFAVQIELPKR